jgi:site-specific DNA-adenine methylase
VSGADRDRGGVLWPYYGGKWRAALRYPIPRSTVVEPFAGAAGYSLRWAQQGFRFDVHLYDLDERVAALWRYLVDSASRGIATKKSNSLGYMDT